MNLLIDYLENREEYEPESLNGICEHLKQAGTDPEDMKDVLLNFIEAGCEESDQEDVLLDQIQILDGFDVFRYSIGDDESED